MGRQVIRIAVNPTLLRWARERAGVGVDELTRQFPKYSEWEAGTVYPTLRQLDNLARVTRAPVGCFFLSKPPAESLPIPDFRTVGGEVLRRPSPDLLDTIYLCQQRQDWYREHALLEGEERLSFVGSVSLESQVEATAASIRKTLNFGVEERCAFSTWTEALRKFIWQADDVGVLVMVSGIVASNTSRKLDSAEFRGFALADDIAPVIFINGEDAKSAQMFTLAHELAHIWLGQSALSNPSLNMRSSRKTEQWCNRVAAELLVPLDLLRGMYRGERQVSDEIGWLCRQFKVSRLVMLRRVYDLGGMSREQFRREYDLELERLLSHPASRGGNFYPTLRTRVGRRFGFALVSSALGGRTSFSEAFRLLGIKKSDTFFAAARDLGVIS